MNQGEKIRLIFGIKDRSVWGRCYVTGSERDCGEPSALAKTLDYLGSY